ncbi:hypothetical protein HPB51_014253 [Rhipicephalus microplus]|uniref:Uncharacterized protein n=1 Tax=Rhipicephalus microplus TaxID=6941 RepID=A0A9J6D5B9_RHIMP|nr:hypothetical protein HPB51_014253 [Rhipicephalus microplus]
MAAKVASVRRLPCGGVAKQIVRADTRARQDTAKGLLRQSTISQRQHQGVYFDFSGPVDSSVPYLHQKRQLPVINLTAVVNFNKSSAPPPSGGRRVPYAVRISSSRVLQTMMSHSELWKDCAGMWICAPHTVPSWPGLTAMAPRSFFLFRQRGEGSIGVGHGEHADRR